MVISRERRRSEFSSRTLVVATSTTLKHGDSHGIGPMRMRRLQNTVISMQSSLYRPIIGRLTTDVCADLCVCKTRVFKPFQTVLPYKFNDYISRIFILQQRKNFFRNFFWFFSKNMLYF